jgi:hypothetical protein
MIAEPAIARTIEARPGRLLKMLRTATSFRDGQRLL